MFGNDLKFETEDAKRHQGCQIWKYKLGELSPSQKIKNTIVVKKSWLVSWCLGTLRCGCPWLDTKCLSQLLLLVFQDPVKCISQILSLMCYAMWEAECPWLAPSSPSPGPSEPTDASHHLNHLLSWDGPRVNFDLFFYIFSKWFIYLSVKFFIDMCPCVRDPANYEESCNRCGFVQLIVMVWYGN